MQIDKLYPTSGTTSYDFDLTAPFMQLNDLPQDMGLQYLIGYCTPERMPECCSPVYFNQTAETLTFAADYSKNYGFGFALWGYDGGAAPGNLYYIDGTDTLIRSWGINYDFSFLNRAEMCRVNASTHLAINYEVLVIQKDMFDGEKAPRLLSVGSEISSAFSGTRDYTFTSFKSAIENDSLLLDETFTAPGGFASGKQIHVQCKPSDFGDFTNSNDKHYVAYYDTDNDLYVRINIHGFYMSGNTPVYYNGGSSSANITPFLSIPHTSGKKSIIAPGSYMLGNIHFSVDGGQFTAISQGDSGFGYNQCFDAVNNVVYGAYNLGTLSINDANFSDASANRYTILVYKNFYGVYRGGGIFRIYNGYTPIGIYNYLCLYHKHTDTPSDTYSSEDTVTVFTNSNAPTLQTVSGTLSDIQLDLQPWQYPGIDITVNTFTPENIPDSSGAGTNLIRFGDITPSEFLFGDISIEKIYFGSSLLYRKFVPEQYVTLVPIEKFTTSKYFSNDYRVYGHLSFGEVVLSTRTPRVRNTLPFPYPPAVFVTGDPGTFPFVYHDNGTISWDTTVITSSIDVALRLNMFSLTAPFLYPAGTYTLSVRDYADTSAPVLNLQVRPSDGSSMYTLDDSSTHSGVITFTLNKSCYLHAFMYFKNNRTYTAATIYPQLEAGASKTDYEPVNPASLTTIILPREVGETEYISYADQKIMPTGTPITVPKFKTKIGENVIMIENDPTATNTILLTPATKEQNN